MIRTHSAAVVSTVRSEHAEGPLWNPERGELLWIDQYAGLVRIGVHVGGALRDVRTIQVPAPVGAIVPREPTGWLIAAGAGLHLLEDTGSVHRPLEFLPNDGVRRRMNDGKVDPRGRFWVGSMAWNKAPGTGTLYRIDRGDVAPVLGGLTISNGLAWNRSGDRMWFIDTPTQRVERFRTFAGSVEHDGTAVVVPPEDGHPDGMAIDDEGCLWVALWGGGAVHRFSPAGELLDRVEVGARQVSSCCFGGDDLDTLFITTSGEGYSDDDLARDPDAGLIFAARLGARGLPAARYQP